MKNGRMDGGTDGRPDGSCSSSPRPPVPPSLSIIAAIARNGVIGRAGGLPWKLPGDLQRFKAATMGHPIIMGRRTWESIGRPLPGRLNIVVTRQPGYAAAGCTVVGSLAEALRAAGPVSEVFVIGGASLYREALPRAARLHITQVGAEVEGDTFFPPFDRTAWKTVSAVDYPVDDRNPLPCRVEILERTERFAV